MVKYIPPFGIKKEEIESFFSIFTWNNANPSFVNCACYIYGGERLVTFARADHQNENIYRFIGFTKEAKSVGESVLVQIAGIVEGFSGLTPGADYYISNTPGQISSTPGTYPFVVGVAISSTELLMRPSYINTRAEVRHTTGVRTRASTDTGSEIFLHNLGRIPQKVRITALIQPDNQFYSFGSFDRIGNVQNCVMRGQTYNWNTNNYPYFIENHSDCIVHLCWTGNQSYKRFAATISVSENAITLTWSVPASYGTPPDYTVYYMWEAE